jgi:formamidopyrimidine-DNA glycosylase
MPELPEAETIVRSLRPHIDGARILRAEFRSARVSKDEPERLAGRRVERTDRYGKRVLLRLDQGCLLVKLGMTGSLLWNSRPGPYTRAVIEFEHGRVCFDDMRQFGAMVLLDSPPDGLGPDPLEVRAEEFVARLRARDTQVKRLLLDQSFLRGVGNIYADEALHRAGIRPTARTRRLSARRASVLRDELAALLRLAIEHRGSSVSDYVDAAGDKGGFQDLHRVYGREGEPCRACGTPIRRIVLAQRSAHFCPRCQR